MQWWEVVLLFIGVPSLLCAVVTATVLFLTSSDRTVTGPQTGRGVTSPSVDEQGDLSEVTTGVDETDRAAAAGVSGDCCSPRDAGTDDRPEHQEQTS